MIEDKNSEDQPTEPSAESHSKPALESHEASALIAIKNSTAFLVGDMVIKILGFLFNIYVVRQLGDELLGMYATALSYAGIFSILGDLGMTQYASREIARGRRKVDDLFWDLVVIRLILAIFATAFIVSSAIFLVGYDTNMVIGIFLACIGFFFHAFFGPVLIILTGNERLEYLSILNTLIQLFFVTCGTLVLLFGYTFHILIIATYIGVPVAALIGMAFIRQLKLGQLNFQLHLKSWPAILKSSLPFGIITFTLLAAKDLDTVLLSILRSSEEVGWYRAAYDLTFKLLFIRSAILRPLFPQMARHYGTSQERVGQSFNFAFKLLWTLTLPIAIGTTILAEPIIDLLYGGKYPNSAIILAIIIWSFPLLSLSSLCGTVSTASDKEKKAVRVYTIAALLNLGSNIIAIPLWGYIGAAASTILTEAVTLIFFYRLVHTEFPLKNYKNVLFKPILAGIIMGIVVILMQDLLIIIPILVGAIVYGGVILALKPFSSGELKIINNVRLSLQQKVGLGR